MNEEDRVEWDNRWKPQFYDLSIAKVLQIDVGHASGACAASNKFGVKVLLRDMTPDRARLLALVCTEWADAYEATMAREVQP